MPHEINLLNVDGSLNEICILHESRLNPTPDPAMTGNGTGFANVKASRLTGILIPLLYGLQLNSFPMLLSISFETRNMTL